MCHSLKLWGVPVIDDVTEAAAGSGERESCELCFTDIGLILQQTNTTEFHFHQEDPNGPPVTSQLLILMWIVDAVTETKT